MMTPTPTPPRTHLPVASLALALLAASAGGCGGDDGPAAADAGVDAQSCDPSTSTDESPCVVEVGQAVHGTLTAGGQFFHFTPAATGTYLLALTLETVGAPGKPNVSVGPGDFGALCTLPTGAEPTNCCQADCTLTLQEFAAGAPSGPLQAGTTYGIYVGSANGVVAYTFTVTGPQP